MCASRWSPAISIAAPLVPEDRVRRRVARAGAAPAACGRRTPARRRRRAGASTGALPPQPRNARDTAAAPSTTSRGMPWRSISASASASSRSACAPKSSTTRREQVERAHLGARAAREDPDEADVVGVLVGEHDPLEVLDPPPVLAQRGLELVERLAGVRAGVDQRERVVLDQVAVDAPDHERRRDRQAVDAASPRISASTSSRRRSMSARETRLSRSGAAAARCSTGAR